MAVTCDQAIGLILQRCSPTICYSCALCISSSSSDRCASQPKVSSLPRDLTSLDAAVQCFADWEQHCALFREWIVYWIDWKSKIMRPTALLLLIWFLYIIIPEIIVIPHLLSLTNLSSLNNNIRCICFHWFHAFFELNKVVAIVLALLKFDSIKYSLFLERTNMAELSSPFVRDNRCYITKILLIFTCSKHCLQRGSGTRI